MSPTAWKVTALSLAAVLILIVGLLIGANLGGDSDETTQTTPATTLTPTTTASTTTSTSTTAPAPTTTAAPEVQRLGNRFPWCADLQHRWDELDTEIAGADADAVAAALGEELSRAREEGEDPTGIAQVLLDGSPRQPTEDMANTGQQIAMEQAWMAFLGAATPETLAAIDALVVAAEAHTAATADYEAISAAAIRDSEDSLAAYEKATERALVTFERFAKTDSDHVALNAALDDATAAREAAREAAYSSIDAANLSAETAAAQYMLTTVYTLISAVFDMEGTAAYRSSLAESCR